jgi:DNA modification methylase
MTWAITAGDARTVLAGWPAGAVQTVVTSPPYYLLRDYGTGRWEGGDPACDHRKVRDAAFAVATSTLGGGKKTTGHLQEGYSGQCARCGARRIDEQIGLESSLDAYIANLVQVFRAVRRVLRPDGTLFLNIGDSYSNAGRAGSRGRKRGAGKPGWTAGGALGDKQLLLIPARVALALQSDGWVLRSDIIWSKPNCLPESVTDRPTKSYEHVFMFSKQTRYYYDADAIREPMAEASAARYNYAFGGDKSAHLLATDQVHTRPIGMREQDGLRNARDVWSISTEQFAESHFAVMPTELARRCILAGSRPGDVVADPFTGAGTVGVVALRHGRGFWGAELNESYVQMARERIVGDSPLFNRQEGAA